MRTSKMGSVVAVIGSLVLGVAAHAASVPVPNGDFEQDAVNRDGSNNVGQVAGLPGWDVTGTAGTFKPSASNATFWHENYPSFDAGVHGDLIAFTQGISSFSQTLTATYAPNMVYTLSVLVGDSYESPTPLTDAANPDGLAYAIELSAAGTVVGSASSTTFPVTQTSLTETVIFDTATNPSVVGQPITITIRGYTGGSATFDNVTLDAVPEPAALSLLGLGTLGLLRRRRA